MKITAITAQKRDENRVNVSVDGRYRFSLDMFQVVELGIKVGQEFTESELENLERESQFGKIYSRSLEYCFVRPRSEREVEDYLYKKTIPRRTKIGSIKQGIDKDIIPRVIERLSQKGYINDHKFAEYWVENRFIKRGISRRKLVAELRSKGVDPEIINQVLENSNRSDESEIKKVIERKPHIYDDKNKLIVYLVRAGFRYDQIKEALDGD
jgi:regulatory protein